MALSDGLVGYWSAWQGSSGYRLLDRTGRGNHGTLTNMDAGTDWVGATVQGRSGFALDFDGSNDFVSASNLPTRGNADLISIGGWFFGPAASYTFSNYFFSIPLDSSGSNGIDFTNPQAVRFNLFGSGVSNLSINTTIDLRGKWTFLVGVFDGAKGLVYADGVLSAQANHTAGASTASRQFNLGRFGSFGGFAAIRCAEAFVFYRALAASEVQQIYNLGPGWYQPYRKRGYGYAVAAAGFKPYWHRRETQIIGGGLR